MNKLPSIAIRIGIAKFTGFFLSKRTFWVVIPVNFTEIKSIVRYSNSLHHEINAGDFRELLEYHTKKLTKVELIDFESQMNGNTHSGLESDVLAPYIFNRNDLTSVLQFIKIRVALLQEQEGIYEGRFECCSSDIDSVRVCERERERVGEIEEV